MSRKAEATQMQLKYVRTFSSLGKLQQAHEIRYELILTDKGWDIRLEEQADPQMPKAKRVKLTCTATMAYSLVRLLYENAVPVENFREVVYDWVPDNMIRE